tara:strand:+ start:981 stop:1517 length:537 start_codon:yes stop_codon:yes gene_type:complete
MIDVDIFEDILLDTITINDNIYIGIDPGISGGIACITCEELFAIKCPTTIADMNDKVEAIAKVAAHTGYKAYAVIESVHSMPGQGVVSTFKFGMNYGQWLGILSANKISYTQATPQKWMKWLGAMPKVKKDRKNHIKHLAQQRYPETKITLATSDAVMLAEYCRYHTVASVMPKDLVE